MKLSDIFGTSVKQTDKNREKEEIKESASQERINKHIKALTPGKTLQGEVIGKNGSEVKIKLSEDIVLTAKLDKDVNVEEGRVLTFEVKNNGSTLSLSPLFANTATADNVFKALRIAGLPVNGATVEMTEAMMQEGMSIDAKTLQSLFKEVTMHPGSAPANIVQLHRLGVPVDESSLQQMEQYKALTHQLIKGMTDVLSELPGAFSQVEEAAGKEAALRMYARIIEGLLSESGTLTEGPAGEGPTAGNLVSENGVILPETGANGAETSINGAETALSGTETSINGAETALSGTEASINGAETGPNGTETALNGAETARSGAEALKGTDMEALPNRQPSATETLLNMVDIVGKDSEAAALQEAGITGAEGGSNGIIPQNLTDSSVASLLSAQENEQLVQHLNHLAEEINIESATPEMAALKGELTELIKNLSLHTATAEDVLQSLHKVQREDSLHEALSGIYKSAGFQKLLSAAAIKQWALKPENVGADGKVEEMYARLLKQLDIISKALQEAGADKSATAKSAANVSQNIDFINQMNHLYTYVQLPLKMSGQNANGELYVYTNKRSLAKNDGNVSAFLHLDMEHLGPVDVYVAMQQERVNTRFTLQDDEMLDFLQAHMHILDERLAKKGYTMHFEMSIREDGPEHDPIDRILHGEKNTTVLSQYAFDVRA